MWFKNIRIYTLKEDITINPQQMETGLGSFAFSHCTSMEIESQGFVPPLGNKATSLVHECDGKYLFCARFEKKLLPASVIKDEILEKIEEFTDTNGRAPKGKEKAELKDAVMLHLLPLAFATHKDVYAWIDLKEKLVITNTSSAKQAEATLSLLRKALGSLPLKPLDVNEGVSSSLTKWLLDNAVPSSFELGERISMYSPSNEKKIVNAKSDNLMEDEILQHLRQGKLVSKIALKYDGVMSFVLDEDLSVKSIKLDDEFISGKYDDQSEDLDETSRLSADYFIQLDLFSRLVSYLIKQFGGISK